MLGSEAVALIQDRLGFRTDHESRILAAMNESQRLLEKGKTLPRFLILEDQTFSLVAGALSTPLPAAFIKIDDEGLPHYTSDTDERVELELVDYESLRRLYSPTAEGGPYRFSIRATTLAFAPPPSTAATLTWSYYAHDEEIELAGENLWLENVPHLIVGSAGRQLARTLGNERALLHFEQMATEWFRAMFNETVEQETDGPIVMGGL